MSDDQRRPYLNAVLRFEVTIQATEELLQDRRALEALVLKGIEDELHDARDKAERHLADLVDDVIAQLEAARDSAQAFDRFLPDAEPEPGPRMGTWDAET